MGCCCPRGARGGGEADPRRLTMQGDGSTLGAAGAAVAAADGGGDAQLSTVALQQRSPQARGDGDGGASRLHPHPSPSAVMMTTCVSLGAPHAFARGQVSDDLKNSMADLAVVWASPEQGRTAEQKEARKQLDELIEMDRDMFHSCQDLDEVLSKIPRGDGAQSPPLDSDGGLLVTAAAAGQLSRKATVDGGGVNVRALGSAERQQEHRKKASVLGGVPRLGSATPGFAQTSFAKASFAPPTGTAVLPLPDDVTVGLPPGEAKGKGKGDYHIMKDWSFLTTASTSQVAVERLRKGSALFCCVPCLPGSGLGEVERAIGATFVNMSSFKDETAENCVPRADMDDQDFLDKHLFLMSKTQYLLPSWEAAERLTVAVWISPTFQRSIAPSGTKVVDKVFDKPATRDSKVKRPAVDTFCLRRDLIAFFSVTTQYRTSILASAQLSELAALCDGVVPRRGLLFERTRDDWGTDPTVKNKQVLLLHPTPGGGALVSHVQLSVFSSLPALARKALGRLAEKGAQDAAETALRARAALAAPAQLDRLGDGENV